MSGQSTYKNPKKVFSQKGQSLIPIDTRVTYLENNVYKITYFESVASASGTITIPTGATILLDQLSAGNDAYAGTIINGQPTGSFPETAGGVAVVVSSFDALGNYTLSGTPSAFPIALIYVLSIQAKNYQNLTTDNILDLEDINAVTRVASTDEAIVRFNGTTGEVQNSAVTITDNGSVVFPPLAGQSYARGLLQYDSDNESLSFYNNESDIFMQIGQEIWMRCRNTTGSTITNGQAVYVNGTSAGLPTIALAQANSASTTVCAGLTTHSIENNTIGYVTVIGTVRGLDTSALSTGNVFLSSTVAGGLTNTSPTSPNYRYRIGFVTVVNVSVGTIQVTPTTAALGNGTADQLLGINVTGNQEFINKPYDILGHRKTGTTTFERWYNNSINCTALATVAIAMGVIRYLPFVVPKTITLDRIGIEISGAGTAASVLRIGIYNSSNTLPSTLNIDAGTILGDSATMQSITINKTLLPGMYFFAINHNSVANITVRAVAISSVPPILGLSNTGGTIIHTYYSAISAYSTFANPAVTPDNVTNSAVPSILFRLSA